MKGPVARDTKDMGG